MKVNKRWEELLSAMGDCNRVKADTRMGKLNSQAYVEEHFSFRSLFYLVKGYSEKYL